jgi:hypothetical protein
VGFSPQSRVTVTYVPATKTYSIAQNGRVMPGVAPTNVIVQRVTVRSSNFSDVNGMRTPFTVTIGKGVATVMRDGLAYTGTWSRKGVGPTRFLGIANKDIPMRPGPTWVLLLPKTGSVTYS